MNDKYPSLPFESDNIKKIRRQIQKSRENEEALAYYLFRPVSLYISMGIYKYTKIQANHITFVMAVYSLIIPLLIYFFNAIERSWIMVVAFAGLYFLDVIDGEIARLRKKTSQLGYLLDMVLWYAIPLNYFLFVNQLIVRQGYSQYLVYLNWLALVLHFYLIQLESLLKNKEKQVRSASIIMGVVKLPFTMFGFLLFGYHLCVLIGNGYSFIYYYIISIPILYISKSIYSSLAILNFERGEE
ncbi:CDP-alcohol phosphatidyltransferase family protein [Limnohabitans sp. WS1]|uniref:CDP-alcohol phosphatidyltransferase family protein n=1 Tax=Limnohabitans sp. WS1 TaxID=1100726 RepID=UPI000D3C0490|nr:CDP-alcohol phosphatidyltransferase family protein [Limnohabitans sp. WS1]PUE05935.1 hypothetical protein B9Z48_21160 [Limnohabitans sp. WS1]